MQPELIKMRAELTKMRAKGIKMSAELIKERHEHVRSCLTALGGEGNESGGVSTLPSIGRKRFKTENQASPSAFEKLSNPDSGQSLQDVLFALPSENDEGINKFQKFVATLIKHAESSEDSHLIENTVKAIMAYPTCILHARTSL